MLGRVSPDADPAFAPEAAPAVGAAAAHVVATTLEDFLAAISTRAFRFAELGLRHRDDALDAVQEAMIRMLGYRERPPAEWTPLFWSILRTRIIDIQRRNLFRLRWLAPRGGRERDDEIDWIDQAIEQAPDDAPDPSRNHDGREAYSHLAVALRALPRRQREAFTLRVLEDCDVATTARIMGCGEGAVKTHLSRAREALQRHLEDFR